MPHDDYFDSFERPFHELVLPDLVPLHDKLRKIKAAIDKRPIIAYAPHKKQVRFHQEMRRYSAIMGANRGGKTRALVYEVVAAVEGTHAWKPRIETPFSIYLCSTTLAKLEETEQLAWWVRRMFPPDHPMGAPQRDPRDPNSMVWPDHGVSIYLKSEEQKVGQAKGGAPALIVIDEEIRESFYEELEVRRVSSGGQIIIGATSTPEEGGLTWMYEDIVMPVIDAGGINANLHEDIGLVNISMYDNPHISAEEIAAYRKKLHNKPHLVATRIDGVLMPRSKSPVFDQDALYEMRDRVRPPAWRGRVHHKPLAKEPALIEMPHGPLAIWNRPRPKGSYLVGVDSTRGGKTDDYGVIMVLDRDTMQTSAVWRERLAPDLMAEAAAGIATFYNNAFIICEAANAGYTILTGLRLKYRYDNLYTMHNDTKKALPTHDVGWKTNATSKAALIDALASVIRSKTIWIQDDVTYNEALVYTRNPKKGADSMSAPPNMHDDTVIALGLCCFVRHNAIDHNRYVDEVAELKVQLEDEALTALYDEEVFEHPQLGKVF